MLKFNHTLAVRNEQGEDGFYREYDKHDRVVYHKDKWGYFSFLFYEDEQSVLPSFALHKYWNLYNNVLS